MLSPGMQFIQDSKLKLLKYIVKFVKDEAAAEDIFQDIIIIYYKLDEERQKRADDHLIQWLFLVAKRECLDFINDSNRMFYEDFTTTNGPEENGNLKDLVHNENPYVLTDRKEQTLKLNEFIDKLPSNQALVTKLRYFNQLDYKTISLKTGLSFGNVGFLLNRATKNLRELFISYNKPTNKSLKV